MRSLRSLEMFKEVKRSELAEMAKKLVMESHKYIQYVIREYPEIEIINDYLEQSVF